MGKDETPDLRDRIRLLLGTLSGGVDRIGSTSEVASIIDSANRALGTAMAWWGENASVQRLIGGVQHDTLTGAGERVDLTARLGIASKLGSFARFVVDDEVAAEVPIGADWVACARLPAQAPGVHRVGISVCDSSGTVLSDSLGYRVLQVVDRRPVALIDGELVLQADQVDQPDQGDLARKALEALVAEGFELAYFDFHERDRTDAIHDQLREQGLPPGAVLAHSAQDVDPRTLGLNFVRLFGLTAVRRLRAKGVPVTLIVTRVEPERTVSDAEQLQILTPAEVLDLSKAGELGSGVEQARALLREREVADSTTWRLDQATRSSLVPGNRFHAELDNQRARQSLFDAIDSANESIHVQFYIVRPSAFTETLIVKLIRRARAGVQVRFMVDALYSDEQLFGRRNPLIQSLRAEANVEVVASRPIESPQEVGFETLKRRDHRKITIIDGRHAFVSGRNASDEYFTGFDEVPIHDNTRHERIPWLDAHVEVRGPLVRVIQQTFIEAWIGQGGTAIDDESVLPEIAHEGSASGRLVVHRGFEDANGLAMYEEMLDLAEDHVYIVNDFPIVTALENAIYRLVARDVSVTLLTGSAMARRDDGTFFPGPFYRTAFEFMVKAKFEPLMRAGVEVYEFVPPPSPIVVARSGRIRPYVHAKMVLVDGRLATIGSANLDVTASFWESEANVVVQDEAFATSVEETLREMISGSVRLDLDSEYWKQERAQRAVVATLWPGTFYS